MGLTPFTTGGAELHTLTTAEMPSHTHDVQGTGHNIHDDNTTFGFGDGGIAATKATDSQGGGNAHNTMQPSAFMIYLIKT